MPRKHRMEAPQACHKSHREPGGRLIALQTSGRPLLTQYGKNYKTMDISTYTFPQQGPQIQKYSDTASDDRLTRA